MLEKLQLLQELQELDKEMRDVDQQRHQYDAEQANLQDDLSRVQVMVDSLVTEIDELVSQRKELLLAETVEQDNILRSEGRLPQIKTQKEYVAVLKEVDTAKKMAKELQDQIETKETQLEVLSSDKEEKDKELAGLTEKVEGRQAEIAAAVGEYARILEEKQSRRKDLMKGLPAPLQKRYQLLLDRRDGLAVVEARNGACMGCHMHLPPQLFNSLYRSTEIHGCPHCNRLMFIAEQA